jgi:translation initiation factor 2 subunit 2
MTDEEYMRMLDRAFAEVRSTSADTSDFVIPKADSLQQGSKTILRNLGIIAERARRSAADIARYLSRELGVPVSVDGSRLNISGKFSGADLDNRISGYFEIYVVCRECHKPDTRLEGAGRGMFYLVCEACGARYGVKHY